MQTQIKLFIHSLFVYSLFIHCSSIHSEWSTSLLSMILYYLFFCLSISCVYGNFDKTVRSHLDYESTFVNMEIGWGATRCLDFQEVSTIYRPITFEPALVVTCELKSHQCVTIRAMNTTHYYTFQGCLPQARVSKMCTEMAYEASKMNGEEYFYCYDVAYDRLNVPRNVPLFGRECCCNGDLCNRIENVKTIDTIIPHDQILNPYFRTIHLWYWNAIRFIGGLSAFATLFFWGNIFYIILKPAERDDDKGWYSAPVKQNQLMDDIPDEEDEDGEDKNDETEGNGKDEVFAEAKKRAKEQQIDFSRKKKTHKKRKTTKEDTPEHMYQTQKTQDNSQEELPVAKTGDDKDDDKKEDKKASKETTDKEKKDETPIDTKEKKTQEAEPKKEEKEEEAKMFKLDKKPKKLANGRIIYNSMFNEDSGEYSEEG